MRTACVTASLCPTKLPPPKYKFLCAKNHPTVLSLLDCILCWDRIPGWTGKCHVLKSSQVYFIQRRHGHRGGSTMWHLTPDTWHLTPDTWHLTPDTWHLTPDTWHLTPDTWHLNTLRDSVTPICRIFIYIMMDKWFSHIIIQDWNTHHDLWTYGSMDLV